MRELEGEYEEHRKTAQREIADAKEELMEQLQPFGRHVYNIRRQFAERNLQIRI